MMRRSGTWPLLLAVGMVFGCEGSAFGPYEPPTPRGPQVRKVTRLVEDFDNRDLIETETGAIIDVNRGIVTLEANVFPDIDGHGEVLEYDSVGGSNGLLEADSIVVREQGAYSAPDSAEFRAQDLIHISGELYVGRGGITFAAGKKIVIDGSIDSEGPVLLVVGDREGQIIISGRITVHGGPEAFALPAVSVAGRGTVDVNGGRIESIGEANATSGDIEIATYGDITVRGANAAITTSGGSVARSGIIRLKSEGDVNIIEGAEVGRSGYAPPPSGDSWPAAGGDLEIQGQKILIGDDCRVAAASATGGRGGSVFLTAEEHVRSARSATIEAGAGPTGGSLVVKSRRITVGQGSALRAGTGSETAGIARLEAVESFSLAEGASVIAGSGACALGGDVTILVGGTALANAGSLIQGGPSEGFTNCGRLGSGGNVEIIAREAIGLHDAARGGSGAPVGRVRIEIDPDLEVPQPNLTVSTGGFIESKVIDRGVTSVGLVPRLIQVAAEKPDGTSVQIQLAGADDPAGPFETWHDVVTNDQVLLDPLAPSQYLRYRVNLKGRTFDAPILDYFEIDLAPSY